MNSVEIEYQLPDGDHLLLNTRISDEEEPILFHRPGAEEVADFVMDRLRRAEANTPELQDVCAKVEGWNFRPAPVELPDGVLQVLVVPRESQQAVPAVSRARTVLSFGHRLLPSHLRQETLDEWMDEIETAADAGLPVRRRALSILLRSLPVLVLRSRLPARVRGGGS